MRVQYKIETEQVPVRKEHEADKDLEQRYAKVMAWLIDNERIEDLSFDINTGISWYVPLVGGYTRTEPRLVTAEPGEWVVIECGGRPYIVSDEEFKKTYTEVK